MTETNPLYTNKRNKIAINRQFCMFPALFCCYVSLYTIKNVINLKSYKISMKNMKSIEPEVYYPWYVIQTIYVKGNISLCSSYAEKPGTCNHLTSIRRKNLAQTPFLKFRSRLGYLIGYWTKILNKKSHLVIYNIKGVENV